jgi:prepilin-type N-terminal cleavage/methylation domain-containing protein
MIHYFFTKHRPKAFTVIELMVSLTILTMISLGAARIYMNYTASSRDLKASNLVYQEARFLMERIVREVRQNAVDYEGYFSRNVLQSQGAVPDPVYNENFEDASYNDFYCWYDMMFYSDGADDDLLTFDDNDSTGLRNPDYYGDVPAISDGGTANPMQDELQLINISGNTKTIIKRIEDSGTPTIGRVAMLRLVGQDFGTDRINASDPDLDGSFTIGCDPDNRENDGLIDTWLCDEGFVCPTETVEDFDILSTCEGVIHRADDSSFVDISPSAVNVVNLKFIIAPEDDPWKAYNSDSGQIQPHITIQMTVEANPAIVSLNNPDRIPSITLTSTASTRNYDEIKSPCGTAL